MFEDPIGSSMPSLFCFCRLVIVCLFIVFFVVFGIQPYDHLLSNVQTVVSIQHATSFGIGKYKLKIIFSTILFQVVGYIVVKLIVYQILIVHQLLSLSLLITDQVLLLLSKVFFNSSGLCHCHVLDISLKIIDFILKTLSAIGVFSFKLGSFGFQLVCFVFEIIVVLQ